MDFLETSAHTTENLSEVSYPTCVMHISAIQLCYIILQAFSMLTESILTHVSIYGNLQEFQFFS